MDRALSLVSGPSSHVPSLVSKNPIYPWARHQLEVPQSSPKALRAGHFVIGPKQSVWRPAPGTSATACLTAPNCV